MPLIASAKTYTNPLSQNTTAVNCSTTHEHNPRTPTTINFSIYRGPPTCFDKNVKKDTKKTKYFGFDNGDSSVESTSSCPPNLMQPRRKKRVGDVVTVQPSVVQTIATTAAHVDPSFNPIPSPDIREVSPTDPRIRLADSSPKADLFIDE